MDHEAAYFVAKWALHLAICQAPMLYLRLVGLGHRHYWTDATTPWKRWNVSIRSPVPCTTGSTSLFSSTASDALGQVSAQWMPGIAVVPAFQVFPSSRTSHISPSRSSQGSLRWNNPCDLGVAQHMADPHRILATATWTALDLERVAAATGKCNGKLHTRADPTVAGSSWQ